MFYLRKRIAQVMAMSIMVTNIPVKATVNHNDLSSGYSNSM